MSLTTVPGEDEFAMTAAALGLDRVIEPLERLWGEPITFGRRRRRFHIRSVNQIRNGRPTTECELRCGDATAWIPAPMAGHEADGPLAPVYEVNGTRCFVPVLWLESSDTIDYLRLSHWFEDALGTWRLEHRRDDDAKTAPPPATLLERMAELGPEPERDLPIVALMIRYALQGTMRPRRTIKSYGLVLPKRNKVLLRLVEPRESDTELARYTARHSVRLMMADENDGVPKPAGPAKDRCLKPHTRDDVGIDPVHTHPGKHIRRRGYLGHHVRVSSDRRLEVPEDMQVALSPCTAQIPFSEYNDPRRLMLGARAQARAIPLTHPERPIVDTDAKAPAPPGLNLRVGYLAWRGLNHEDAWVLSKSAASRFEAVRKCEQWIFVHRVEAEPDLLVAEGDDVAKGGVLVQRRLCPFWLVPPGKRSKRTQGVFEHMIDGHAGPVALNDALVEDKAAMNGRVADIETFALLDEPEHHPADWLVTPEIRRYYRSLIRITIERVVPLKIGSKLANRHGHKGVVAAILADDQMPRWRGQPLEALVDPIGVINRMNWGQLHETLAGACLVESDLPPDLRDRLVAAVRNRQNSGGNLSTLLEAGQHLGARKHGTWPITPGRITKGLTGPVDAVAGRQFVMQLPDGDDDDFQDKRRIRRRGGRISEQERWALWGHGHRSPVPALPTLNTGARQLARMLAVAGYELDLTCGGPGQPLVRLRHLALDKSPPDDGIQFHFEYKRMRQVEGASVNEFEQNDALGTIRDYDQAKPAYLCFDPPVHAAPCPSNDPETRPERTIRWLPLLPLNDRPARSRQDRGLQPSVEANHKLTELYSKLGYAAMQVTPGSSLDTANDKRRKPLQGLLTTAYRIAVGSSSRHSKRSLVYKQVFSVPHTRIERRTIVPALGPDHLDKITVPRKLLERLAPPPKSHHLHHEPQLWLKRDPVLHRWGLLSVRCRAGRSKENVIRLPASLLGPLGADFDGDLVAVRMDPFGVDNPDILDPVSLAWDDEMKAARFLPGKQYRYGLDLVARDRERLDALNTELQVHGAPRWNADADTDIQQASNDWVKAVTECVDTENRTAWWGILERHALTALRQNPGMDLGLLEWEAMQQLPVVACGAAKGNTNRIARRIYDGQSLEVFKLARARQRSRRVRVPRLDTIGRIMVSAEVDKGRYGNVPRRLTYGLNSLTPELARAIQTVTEHATQKVLSLKSGDKPPEYAKYDRFVMALLNGKQEDPVTVAKLDKLFEAEHMELWSKLRKVQQTRPNDAVAGFLAWLKDPSRLATLLEADGAELHLPVNDLRASLFWYELREPEAVRPGNG